mgnify:CR=1 FL=1
MNEIKFTIPSKGKFTIPFKENHRALWLWLAAHPRAWKEGWPGWKTIKEYTGLDMTSYSYCFLCKVHVRIHQWCEECPLGNCFRQLNNLYWQWNREINFSKRSALAIQIANCWK